MHTNCFKTVQWSVITMIQIMISILKRNCIMHLSATIPGGGRSRGVPGHLHNDVTNPPYQEPIKFDGLLPLPKTKIHKKLLTPLHGGQRSVLCQVNRCNISKELYRRNRIFLPKNIVAMWVKDGQLKGTEYKRNMKVVYRLFCRHFARTCSPTYPVLSQTGTALVSSSGKWRRRYKSLGCSPGDPATKVQKQSNPPIISRAWN